MGQHAGFTWGGLRSRIQELLYQQYKMQLCGSGSGRNSIHLGPWNQIQRFKMKEKAEFNQHFFFVGNYIFFKSEPQKVANLWGLGTVFFFYWLLR